MSDYLESLPDVIQVCPRCHSHLLFQLPALEGSYCYRCGYTGGGVRYERCDSR